MWPWVRTTATGLSRCFLQRLLDALGGLVARVDDHALLTGGGGDQVTVGPPGPGGEPGNEHDRPSIVVVREVVRGRNGSSSEPTGAAVPQRTHIRYGAHAGARSRTHASHRRTRRMRRRPGGQPANSGGGSSPGRSSCGSSSAGRAPGARRSVRNAVIAAALGVVVAAAWRPTRPRVFESDDEEGRRARRGHPSAAPARRRTPCDKPAEGKASR